MNHSSKPHSLSNKIVKQFITFTLLLAVAFGALNFLNLYIIEDEYFHLRLKEEYQYFISEYEKTGQWPVSRVTYIELYQDESQLPEKIKLILKDEPERIEMETDNGDYYHLLRSKDYPGLILTAEVSNLLLVRAYKKPFFILISFWTGVMIIIAVIFGYRLSKKALSPLSQLAAQVSSLSPDNLPDNFSRVYPNNEIGKLAFEFESTVKRIKNFIVREQHFTRDASHELRTPVAIIKSSTEILLTQANNFSVEEQNYLRKIMSATSEMEQTITTLLSLAREENKGLSENTEILPLIEKIIVQQAYLIEHKDIEIKIDVPAKAVVQENKNNLHILLTNLISNAFKYTQQGTVTILYRAEFENKIISISDTGNGIETEIREVATETLVKGKESQGFGIGLSLVNRLCEHLNIQMTLIHLDEGTSVELVWKV